MVVVVQCRQYAVLRELGIRDRERDTDRRGQPYMEEAALPSLGRMPFYLWLVVRTMLNNASA